MLLLLLLLMAGDDDDDDVVKAVAAVATVCGSAVVSVSWMGDETLMIMNEMIWQCNTHRLGFFLFWVGSPGEKQRIDVLQDFLLYSTIVIAPFTYLLLL